MLVQEENVLELRKVSLQNPDHWPTFNLERITVLSQKTGKKTSLLSAHRGNPVRVTGTLEEIDNDLLHLVRDKNYRDLPIELSNVTMYAFAECEDASFAFWAAGKAGWFEIQGPARSFKTTYNKMEEAASIFYMLADKLRRAHRRSLKLTTKALQKYATQVFQDYLAHRGPYAHLTGVDDVCEAFHLHREFLITSMIEGQDGLDWTETPMWNYFKLKFLDDFASIQARILGNEILIQSSIEATSDRPKKRKSQSPHIDENQTKKGKKGKKKAPETKQPITPINNSTIDVSSSGEDPGGNPNVITRKRKSILQPSGGKFSKKAAARRRNLAATQDPNESQEDDDEVANSQDPAEESPVTTIRNAKDLELLTNPPTYRSSPDATPSPTFLPRKYLALKVVEYSLPSTEPQGPGDLWTCTFEGCFHRVHEASTSSGNIRIKEHFKIHATQAQEKIDLALNESRPYLPVDNLVRRLQAFAPSPGAAPSPDSLERKFSTPIRRRY